MSWKSLTYIDMLYTKMTLWPRRIFLRCSWTSIASDTDVRQADIFLASLLTPRDACFTFLTILILMFGPISPELIFHLPPTGLAFGPKVLVFFELWVFEAMMGRSWIDLSVLILLHKVCYFHCWHTLPWWQGLELTSCWFDCFIKLIFS